VIALGEGKILGREPDLPDASAATFRDLEIIRSRKSVASVVQLISQRRLGGRTGKLE
jgi:hypothetical protein